MATKPKVSMAKAITGTLNLSTPFKTTMPTSVTFLGRYIPIEYRTGPWDKQGEFDCETLSVQILEGLPRSEEADTVLHELLHGIDVLLDLDLTERHIRLIATGLYGMLQENPAFAQYLVETTNKPNKQATSD